MAEANSLPLLSQYSDVFTRLHGGKLRCMHYGMDRVSLNRFILDSANSTAVVSSSELLTMVDLDLVEYQGSVEEKLAVCEGELSELVALQEEVNTLQRIAKEKGITGSYLNIVGQASIQSPEDHGASVIHQLSALMGGSDLSVDTSNRATILRDTADPSQKIDAANDEPEPGIVEQGKPGFMRRMHGLLVYQWQALGIDMMVCFLASLFAIRLVS